MKIVALEPASSPVLSTGKGGPSQDSGIGAGFVPDVLNTTVYDEIFTVENDDAFATGKLLAKKEGILVGISSGSRTLWSDRTCKTSGKQRKTIVALLPDTETDITHTALHGVEYEFFQRKADTDFGH